jgi:signal peptidase II
MQAARGASLNPSGPTHPPADTTRASGPRSRSLVLLAVIALVGYGLDLGSKIWAVAALTGEPPVPVVGRLVTFYLARNPGAAFSTGTSYTIVLTFVALAAAVAVLWFARRLRSTGWAIGLGFLLAGVLGNLTDRIFRSPGVLRGHVIDFISLPHWPIFNVADMCINVAAAAIIVQALRGVAVDGTRTREPRNRPEQHPAS